MEIQTYISGVKLFIDFKLSTPAIKKLSVSLQEITLNGNILSYF